MYEAELSSAGAMAGRNCKPIIHGHSPFIRAPQGKNVHANKYQFQK